MLMALLTPWKLAMVSLLACMLCQRLCGARVPTNKLRTWAALMGCSVVGAIVAVHHPATQYDTYAVLCLAAAVMVMVRPAGIAQHTIGIIFAAMIAVHVGAGRGDNVIGSDVYMRFNIITGWAQFAILAGWTGSDVGRSLYARIRGRVGLVDHKACIGAAR